MKANMTRIGLAGFVFVAMAMLTANSTNADCSTCATPVVAYQPVAVQPVVTTQYRGWYPGKWLDSLRLRNYGVAAPVAPAYTPAYISSGASYAPYTASYPTYTAGYTPYVTAFAPLRRTVVARPLVQTAYYPTLPASPCSTCVQTVARRVVLSPVVTAGCSTCAVPHCGGCSACSTVPAGVSQASFAQPGCSSCATSPAIPSYPSAPSLAPTNPGSTVGPATPQPTLVPNEPAPARSNYRAPTPAESHSHGTNGVVDPLDNLDPLPQQNLGTDTTFEAPRLFDPNDRTAQRRSSSNPTVDVWNAVYHKSSDGKVIQTPVHQTSGKPARTQAEIDADGWQSIPRSR